MRTHVNTISKIIGVKCGADQFQCKAGICKYSDNANCNGPCILYSWANDGEEDCSDGSDEDIFDYDYDYDDDFQDFIPRSVEPNTVKMPTSNTLRLKVILKQRGQKPKPH